VRDPGEGAIEYASSLVNGLTRAQAAVVFEKLRGNPPPDSHVKLCSYCGYYFRDKTKNGSSKVCGESCRTPVKSKQRGIQRAKKSIIKPKQRIYYQWWHEYPFWSPESAMFNRVWSYEKPFGNIENIQAAKERNQTMGGREGKRGQNDRE
jgi:hypothetical protein